MSAINHSEATFGPFSVNFDAFELARDGENVDIEPQVFSLLTYLIRHRDRVVSKDELLDELWGHRYVSESALSTQIKSLRRAVGDDGQNQNIVQTVRGRGFRFVAEISEPAQRSTEAPVPQALHNIPRERTPLVGREEDLDRLHALIRSTRFTSVLGIGGTGKTRLAMRVAKELASEFSEGVWFVDLIPLKDIDALETAVAETIGLSLDSTPARPQLIQAIAERSLLLVFDNCEHLKDEAADLIDAFLEYTNEPRILATSRDPIELVDEHRFYLEPLATSVRDGVSPAELLFRSTAERHGAILDSSGDLVQTICAQLDGLPLAIELAAAQLRHLTLEELAQRLTQRFEVLAGRERSPSGRQTNLLGVLQDTWDLLANQEREMLGFLATFPSRFSIADLEESLNDAQSGDIAASIARLVDLSLVQRMPGRGSWWRLLETVRMFALEQTSAEMIEQNAARHAHWCLIRLGRFPDDQMDNLSQADWCLDHYADLDAAEKHFEQRGELESAYAICAGTGLLVQLDDGAHAREKLLRAERYLEGEPSDYWRARLHSIAGLCAQANRSPAGLLEHTDKYMTYAQSSNDPALYANALLMKSLTTGFVDSELAHQQLSEMVEIGRSLNNQSLIDSGECYHAWQYVVDREVNKGREQAEVIYERFSQARSEIDNPAYNCVGIVVTSTVVDEPEIASAWAGKLSDFPAVDRFWGIQNLIACVEASSGEIEASAKRCLQVKDRLNRATRDEFPDLLVTAVLGALRQGEMGLVTKWLAAIRYGGSPIQMYHTITMYRQLYDQHGVGDFDRSSAPSLDDVRSEVHAWWEACVSGGG